MECVHVPQLKNGLCNVLKYYFVQEGTKDAIWYYEIMATFNEHYEKFTTASKVGCCNLYFHWPQANKLAMAL